MGGCSTSTEFGDQGVWGRKCWLLSLSAGDAGMLPPLPTCQPVVVTCPQLCEHPGGRLSLDCGRRRPLLRANAPQTLPPCLSQADPRAMRRLPPHTQPAPAGCCSGGVSQVSAEKNKQTRLLPGQRTITFSGAQPPLRSLAAQNPQGLLPTALQPQPAQAGPTAYKQTPAPGPCFTSPQTETRLACSAALCSL